MTLTNIEKFIVVGDRVLIRPQADSEKTSSGLYLPAGVKEKEKVRSGYIIKVGPGYATSSQEDDEPWKESSEQVKYIPLQARNDAVEIEFDREKFLIVPQTAVLLLIREDDLQT